MKGILANSGGESRARFTPSISVQTFVLEPRLGQVHPIRQGAVGSGTAAVWWRANGAGCGRAEPGRGEWERQRHWAGGPARRERRREPRDLDGRRLDVQRILTRYAENLAGGLRGGGGGGGGGLTGGTAGKQEEGRARVAEGGEHGRASGARRLSGSQGCGWHLGWHCEGER